MELLERDLPLKVSPIPAGGATGDGRIPGVREAGIGKTSLIERFLAAHRDEARTLLGRCDALFTPQPLGPLHDIALQTDGELLRLMKSAADRLAIFGALLRELKGGGEADRARFRGRALGRCGDTRSAQISRPADPRHGDADHPDLPRRRAGRKPRLVVGARRSASQCHPAHATSSPYRQRRSRVSPCSRAGRRSEVHAQTGGNPFYVTELLASPPGSVPVTVRDATLARAFRLSPPARARARAVRGGAEPRRTLATG